MEYKGKSRAASRRRHPRVDNILLPATIEYKGETIRCQVVSVSTGGCAADVNMIFVEGDSVRIHMEVDDKAMVFPATVTRAHARTVGMRFEKVNKFEQAILNEYILRSLYRDMRRKFK